MRARIGGPLGSDPDSLGVDKPPRSAIEAAARAGDQATTWVLAQARDVAGGMAGASTFSTLTSP